MRQERRQPDPAPAPRGGKRVAPGGPRSVEQLEGDQPGVLNRALAVWDVPSVLDDGPPHEGPAVDLVEELAEDDRAAVEATVVAGLTLRQAAVELGWYAGGVPNAKRVLRARDRGLESLRALARVHGVVGEPGLAREDTQGEES